MSIESFFDIVKKTGSLISSVGKTQDYIQNVITANTMQNALGSSKSPSFAFEQVYATLMPFHYPKSLAHGSAGHPLYPILKTGGLVFPYNPSISEGVGIKYDQIDIIQSNEGYYQYRGTDNVRINISDAVWTCDTFDNAVYALSVLHFFRSYSFMDFGRGKTGRPPSPMWFSAYGNYAFNRVPVLMEKADWSFPNDVDYVGVPNPHTKEYQNKILQTKRTGDSSYTWIPVKFTVSSISLIVQHTPRYWRNFNLDDYYSGAMLKGGRSFHDVNLGVTQINTNKGN